MAQQGWILHAQMIGRNSILAHAHALMFMFCSGNNAKC